MEVNPSPTPPALPIVVPSSSSIMTAGALSNCQVGPKTGITCLPQRAALLKSMLNFLKKAIQVNFLFPSFKQTGLSSRNKLFFLKIIVGKRL